MARTTTRRTSLRASAAQAGSGACLFTSSDNAGSAQTERGSAGREARVGPRGRGPQGSLGPVLAFARLVLDLAVASPVGAGC
jgi:hypothetical protein